MASRPNVSLWLDREAGGSAAQGDSEKQGNGQNAEEKHRRSRVQVGNKRHRPYFTSCEQCTSRDYCRTCFKCKGWVCNGCQPFLKADEKGTMRVIDPTHKALCDDCQAELCGL
eukprot:CAMPEP_0181333862 /NCGR_PEP_ID=MMETSP1101-20121128/25928_1 /TAXON_ID=46948 /ORGANISM="Rhodomonas abbreviata, Strain Caron Lab Isolate" /LENGTH=112 /DNA_ID=CAMNT_0023443751 /DNA_START=172 /DNA_END=510 /DNA_ORIENTATION=-